MNKVSGTHRRIGIQYPYLNALNRTVLKSLWQKAPYSVLSQGTFQVERKKMKNKNYKVVKDDDGKKTYFAKAFGEWIEVTKEVFSFMTSNDRRMRYIYAREAEEGCISLDAIYEATEETENPLFAEDMPSTPGPDNDILDKLCGSTDELFISVINEKIDELRGLDRIIAMEVFINKRSMVEYSAAIRVSRHALMKKVHRISKEIRSSCMKELMERYEG